MRRASLIALVTILLAADVASASPSSACAHLVPSVVPAPVDFTPAMPAPGYCSVCGTDGGGTGLIQFVLEGGQGRGAQFFYSFDGQLVSGQSLSGLSACAFAQKSGFLGVLTHLSADYRSYTELVEGFSHEGGLLQTTTLYDGPTPYPDADFTVAADPRGGALALTSSKVGTGWQIQRQQIDSTGASAGAAEVIDSSPVGQRPDPLGASVGQDGSLLLLTSGSATTTLRNNQLAGRWFDPAGAPRTGWFLIFDQVLDFYPLTALQPDAGRALAVDGFSGTVRPTSIAVTAAPTWLPSDAAESVLLPDRVLVLRPPAANASPCEAVIDVRAPAGNLCGTVTVPAALPGNSSCQAGRMIVGRDGTLSMPEGACGVRFWPRFFQ